MLPSRQAMGLPDAQRALLASRWHRWLVIRKRVSWTLHLVATSACLKDQLVWLLQIVLSETVQDALFVMEPLSQHELLQMGRGRYR